MDYGDRIVAGNMVVACVCRYYGFRARNEQSVAGSLGLLKQVVNASELIPDEVQGARAFENSKGGWWSQALAP